MSLSKHYVDLRELDEDISYHATRSAHFWDEFEASHKRILADLKESEENLYDFQLHVIARYDAIKSLKQGYCDEL